MMHFLSKATAIAAVSAIVLVGARPASAHEDRRVGRFTFAVGWGDEPAYAGFKNSVQLILSDAAGRPVTDLGETLQVEVAFGTETRTLPLEPNFLVGVFGEPGDYRAWMVPTRAGEYTFRFTGEIRGQPIDERFTCSEETFDCIADASEIAFPARDPSTGQLAERLDREAARLSGSVSRADDRAGLATILGIAGTALGALAVLGLVLTRRRAPRG